MKGLRVGLVVAGILFESAFVAALGLWLLCVSIAVFVLSP